MKIDIKQRGLRKWVKVNFKCPHWRTVKTEEYVDELVEYHLHETCRFCGREKIGESWL